MHDGIDIAQRVIEALAVELGVQQTVVALHNAFAHGELFDKAGEHFTDKQLEDCFDHIDGLLEAVKER
jgi:hypothetical protein